MVQHFYEAIQTKNKHGWFYCTYCQFCIIHHNVGNHWHVCPRTLQDPSWWVGGKRKCCLVHQLLGCQNVTISFLTGWHKWDVFRTDRHHLSMKYFSTISIFDWIGLRVWTEQLNAMFKITLNEFRKVVWLRGKGKTICLHCLFLFTHFCSHSYSWLLYLEHLTGNTKSS